MNLKHIAGRMKALTQNIRAEKGLAKGFMNLYLKRFTNISRDEVLGLDIGSSSVKMVQLRKNHDNYVVTAAYVAEIGSGDESNPARREIKTVRAIQDCLQSSGITTKLAVCGLCGPEVAVRYFNFPSLPKDEIEGAITLEASQVCPFSIDDSTVDYQLIPNGPNTISGVLVAATNKLIRKKSQLAEDASLGCVLMDAEGLALLNCLAKYEKPEAGQTRAVLNVGSSLTTLAIVGDNNPPFVRDIAYGGNDIVKQIAAQCGVSTESVSTTLTGPEDTDQACDIEQGIGQACQKLVVDVNETLRYYSAQEKNTAVEKIFVCGGFAISKGFVETLNTQLDAAVQLWNPFDKIRCSADSDCKSIIEKSGHAMAVAAGLAMRSI